MKWLIRIVLAVVAVFALIMISQQIASETGEVVVLTTIDQQGAEHTTRLWVVEHDGSVAGVVICVENNRPKSIKLANLAVHPGHGGQGLGRQLIQHAEQAARDLGHSEMHLNTHKDMADTQRLYLKLGWKELEREGATVMMKKSLASD